MAGTARHVIVEEALRAPARARALVALMRRLLALVLPLSPGLAEAADVRTRVALVASTEIYHLWRRASSPSAGRRPMLGGGRNGGRPGPRRICPPAPS